MKQLPEKPEYATLYLSRKGWEKPKELHKWEWSDTFGRWGRVVTFESGERSFTWPRLIERIGNEYIPH